MAIDPNSFLWGIAFTLLVGILVLKKMLREMEAMQPAIEAEAERKTKELVAAVRENTLLELELEKKVVDARDRFRRPPLN